jgi:hypothetical protein
MVAGLDFLTEFAIRVMTPAVEQIEFDFYYIHEDMSCIIVYPHG